MTTPTIITSIIQTEETIKQVYGVDSCCFLVSPSGLADVLGVYSISNVVDCNITTATQQLQLLKIIRKEEARLSLTRGKSIVSEQMMRDLITASNINIKLHESPQMAYGLLPEGFSDDFVYNDIKNSIKLISDKIENNTTLKEKLKPIIYDGIEHSRSIEYVFTLLFSNGFSIWSDQSSHEKTKIKNLVYSLLHIFCKDMMMVNYIIDLKQQSLFSGVGLFFCDMGLSQQKVPTESVVRSSSLPDAQPAMEFSDLTLQILNQHLISNDIRILS